MENLRSVATPIEKQTLCNQRTREPGAHQLAYKEAIGSLQYAATIAWPDISFATGRHSRYADNPWLTDWVGEKQILQYSHGTAMMQLCLHNGGS